MNAKKSSKKQENLPLDNKDPAEMSVSERKKIKIEFAPGAFDSFDGTQEELQELIAEIKQAIVDGSLFEKSRPVDIDELLDSDDPDDHALAQRLLESLDEEITRNRKLQ